MFHYLSLTIEPNWLHVLSENSMNLGILFGSCGILREISNNENMSNCLKTNLKLASNFIILSSLLNLYRINRR